MNTLLLISTITLWIVVLAGAFLLLGTLRSLGLLRWQIEQLQATRPSRINRNGLTPGKQAPEFTLPRVGGGEGSMSEFLGERLLLLFVQAGCKPCHAIVPKLNQRQRAGDFRVLAVIDAAPDEAHQWAEQTRAEFPVLVQQGFEVSKKYQVFATPFAFVIDRQGRIASSGIVSNKRHIGYLLDAFDEYADRKAQRSGPPAGATADDGQALESATA
jgi:methylamine dehydrogenase accessory protein MauD